jgi:hypothetical protein
MSYLLIVGALIGVSFYYDLSFPLGAGIVLTGITIWSILMNRKVAIPRW